MFCCSNYDDHTSLSRNRSLPSQDVRNSEVEDQTRMGSTWYSELSRPGRDFMSGISLQIFDLMKDRVKDQKAEEERTANPLSVQSPSPHQDLHFQHRQDVAHRLTPGVEPLGRSGYTQASWHVAEHRTSDIHSNSAYSHPPLSSESRVQHSYQSQPAANTNDFSSGALLSHDIQWLDSWTHGSVPGDVDLRSYKRHC